MKTPTVGQKVFLVTNGWRASDPPKTKICGVSKVGRKYFELDGEREQFHIETGSEKTNYTARMKVYESEQDYLDEKEEGRLRDVLSDTFRYGGSSKFTLDQLKRIEQITLEP